jgi:hypothetical protein
VQPRCKQQRGLFQVLQKTCNTWNKQHQNLQLQRHNVAILAHEIMHMAMLSCTWPCVPSLAQIQGGKPHRE